MRLIPLSRCTLRLCAPRLPTHVRFTSTAAVAPAPRLGQPTPATHPHLLKPGELTPGITSTEYSLRRAQLASSLPAGAIAILPSATLQYRSGPVFYEFHQNPDFFYLTGFLEPDSVAVIEKSRGGGEGDHTFHLFVRAKNEHAELWDGARTGVDEAVGTFNADVAYDIDNLPQQLRTLIAKAEMVFADRSAPPRFVTTSFFSQAAGSTLEGALSGRRVQPLKPVMHRLRAIKSGAEAAVMRAAGKYSGRAYNDAMARQFQSEKELAAFLDYGFRVGGCDGSAYVPVVAGGENALSIHYTSNNSLLRDGDLVLVDAGGHYGGYVTDITRTWPVNGRFTPAQRDLYNAVLSVQRDCVQLCKATSEHSLDEIHNVAVARLTQELGALGFDVGGGVVERVLFPHHVGHYVGVDLHDVGLFGRRQRLMQGQVVTVEPGVYVPDDLRWPKHFRGMGVRIEDSVYVGEQRPIVLTVEAVKEIEDIEALREVD